MGEARARALYAYQHSVHGRRGDTPPNAVLYRWRQNHPKGRRFSCYDRTLKVSMPDVVNILKGFNPFTGITAALRRTRQPKGARFTQAAQRGN